MLLALLDLNILSASHGLRSKNSSKIHPKQEASTEANWTTRYDQLWKSPGRSHVEIWSPGRSLEEEDMVVWRACVRPIVLIRQPEIDPQTLPLHMGVHKCPLRIRGPCLGLSK